MCPNLCVTRPKITLLPFCLKWNLNQRQRGEGSVAPRAGFVLVTLWLTVAALVFPTLALYASWVEASEIEGERKYKKKKIGQVKNYPRGLVTLDVDVSQPGQCASHRGWDGRASACCHSRSAPAVWAEVRGGCP